MMARSHIIFGVSTVFLVDSLAGGWMTRTLPVHLLPAGLPRELTADFGTMGLGLAGAAAVVGSLLPDIDHPSSTVAYKLGINGDDGKFTGMLAGILVGVVVGLFVASFTTFEIGLIAGAITALFGVMAGWFVGGGFRALLGGHRGLTHSIFAIVFFLVLGLLAAGPGVAFAIGYASHVLGDLLTREGVRLWYPAATDNVGIGPRWMRFKTGTVGEYAVVAAFVLASVGLRFLV